MDDTLRNQTRDRCLFDMASEQHGYFTAQQAQACGYSVQLMSHHAKRGRFVRIRRGLYRLRDYPSYYREDLVAAWLSIGKQAAVVSHESALEILDLSDAIADAIHITVPRSRRYSTSMAGVSVYTSTRAFQPGDVTIRDGIRVTSPHRTIIDAAVAGTAPEQIERAVFEALERRMVDPNQLQKSANERGQRVASLIAQAIEVTT